QDLGTACIQVPDLHGPAAHRDDPPAIGAERKAAYHSGVSPQGEDLLTRGCVPELDGPIITGGGEAAAVGAERDAPNPLGVSVELGGLSPGPGIPDPHLTGLSIVAADRGELSAVGTEGDTLDRRHVTLEGEELPAGG